MSFKIRVNYHWITFLSILFFFYTTSKSQTITTFSQFDSLKVIEKGETPEIFVSSSILIIGDTAEIYFKHTMPDGTLTDFPANQLFRILLTGDMVKIFEVISKDGKVVTNGLVPLPLKVLAKGPGRVHFNVYAVNPGEFPDSTHRTLTAPNNIMLAKYTGEMGINKLHLHEYENARKYFLEAAKLDSMQKNSCYYNIACAYALGNDTLNALLWLRNSFESGFDDVIHALKYDNDLASIRTHPEFKPIVTMSLIKQRKRWLEECERSNDDHQKGFDYFLIAETYLRQADPDSFFVWYEKALQKGYCQETDYFEDTLYQVIRNDNRFDSLLTYYVETAKTINYPDDILSHKPNLVKRIYKDYVPDYIGKCVNLRELWIKGRPTVKLSDQIENCKLLTSVWFEDSGFEEFPLSFTKLPLLKTLIVNKGNFSEVPADIANNHNLDTLCLINDSLKSLPESIGKLSNLKSLILNNNHISGLPDELGQITTLTNLDLSINCLTEIPGTISKLERLSSLDIHENLIQSIPSGIQHLKDLKRLDVSFNNISSLPEEIGSLESLEYLDVSFNNLTALPADMNRLKNLHILILYGNNIPGETIKSLHSALPGCRIIGKEQNTFSVKQFTNRRMITDTLKGLIFTYPEGYKVELARPDLPERDSVISISFTKLTPLDPDAVLEDRDDSTDYFLENTCTAYISVSENSFSDIAGTFDFQKYDFFINDDKSGDYLSLPSLWVCIGRHNHEAEPEALNFNNWKGFFGNVEWWSNVVTKSGEVTNEEDDNDVHDFYKAIAIKRLSDGRSIFVFVSTDINSEEDIFGNLLSSIKYIGQ
jgi:Leucine-rich repeat (LRR) protein